MSVAAGNMLRLLFRLHYDELGYANSYKKVQMLFEYRQALLFFTITYYHTASVNHAF